MRVLRTILVAFLVGTYGVACAQPLFGRAPSLETRVLSSDTVLVATLASYTLDEEARTIISATYDVTETIKGGAPNSVTIEQWARPRTFFDWIEGKSRALLFGKDGEFTSLHISGPVPQVMLSDLSKLTDVDKIVSAARRIAQRYPAMTEVEVMQVPVPLSLVQGWQNTGTVFHLEVPITEDLHNWAVRAVKSRDAGERERAAKVLGHFGTASDIELLRSMLGDDATIGNGNVQGALGVHHGTYFVRATALAQLRKLGVVVNAPEIEYTKFDPFSVTYVYLERNPDAAAIIRTLSRFENLQRVYIGNCRATDEDLRVICRNQSVTELHASGNPITDAALKDISRLHRLKVLELSGARITDDGLPALAKMQSLEHLDLSNTLITDAGLTDVAKLKNLRSINVANTKVTVEGLHALRGLRHLESVSDTVVDWQQTDAYYLALREAGMLHTNGHARDADDRGTTKSSDVRKFWAYGLRIGDAGLEALTEFTNLEELSISGSLVTNEGLSTALKFKRLKRLLVNNDALISDPAMQTVAKMRGLSSLGIANTSVGDDGFRYVGQLEGLEWLAISGTKVTDAGFFHLRGLTNLRSLVMHGLTVGDAGVSNISSLPRLESILLGDTRITDAGLMLLAANPALKRISFSKAPGISKEALARLRRIRPDIELN